MHVTIQIDNKGATVKKSQSPIKEKRFKKRNTSVLSSHFRIRDNLSFSARVFNFRPIVPASRRMVFHTLTFPIIYQTSSNDCRHHTKTKGKEWCVGGWVFGASIFADIGVVRVWVFSSYYVRMGVDAAR